MKLKIFIIWSILMFLSACSVNIESYSDNPNKLDLREFFSGNTEIMGTLQDRKGKVTRSFHATAKGTFQEDGGKLEEHFIFDDGENQYRNWHVTFIDDNNFTATAEDVVGTAIGKQYGNVINMSYTLRVKLSSGRELDLAMDDWMYMVDKNNVINKTSMSKFGFKVGELTISIRRKDA